MRLIEMAGWSAADAARETGISESAISQIKKGTIVPRDSRLNLLKLVIAQKNPEAITTQSKQEWYGAGLAPWASELVAELDRLEPEQRQRILEAVESMLKLVKPPEVHYGKRR